MSNYYGTTGNDALSGTGLDDKFFVTQGGEDQVLGYNGNDKFYFSSNSASTIVWTAAKATTCSTSTATIPPA